MFKLTFDVQDENHVRYYTVCYTAIALSNRELPVAGWPDVISLTKKLKEMGEETGDTVHGTKLRKLRVDATPLTMTLERAEMAQLLEFVRQPIWRPMSLQLAQETLDWLQSAKDTP